MIGAVRSKRRGITVHAGWSTDRVKVDVFSLWTLVLDEPGSVKCGGSFRGCCACGDLLERLRDLDAIGCEHCLSARVDAPLGSFKAAATGPVLRIQRR